MAQKSWDKMSSQEKIEDLRRDVKRLFEAINGANTSLRQAEKGLSEIFIRVQNLEKKG